MKDAGNVFLVGMMGAGKSTVGRVLARQLGRDFVDTDGELERRCGVKIPVIFEIEGEAGFRAREVQLIDELTARAGVVLATGGGVVLSPQSRARLAARGTVVYLRASLEVLWRRLRNDRQRPLLAAADPRRRIEDLLAEREPLYREVADLIVDTGRRSASVLVRDLVLRLPGQCRLSA